MSDISIEQEAFLNRLGEELGPDGVELVFGTDSDTQAIYTASVLDKYDNHRLQADNELPIGTFALALIELRGEQRPTDRDRGARKVDKWMRRGSIGNLVEKYLEKISSDDMAARRRFIYSGHEDAPEILTTKSGIQVVELTTHEDMADESDFQDSCIGRGNYHAEKLLAGRSRFFSLRHSDGSRLTMEVDVCDMQLLQLSGRKNMLLSLGKHQNANDFLRAVGETLVVLEENLGRIIKLPPYVVAGLGARHYLLTRDGAVLLPERKGFTRQQLAEAEASGLRGSKLSIRRLMDERLRALVLTSQNVDIGLSAKTKQAELDEVLAPGTAINGTLNVERCDPVTLPQDISVKDLFAVNRTGLVEWRNDTKVSGKARVDAANLLRVEGFGGVSGKIYLDNVRDGLLPEILDVPGDFEIRGTGVSRLPRIMKARRVDIATPNVKDLGVIICDDLNVRSIEGLNEIDPGTRVGTLHIAPKTILRWIEQGRTIPAINDIILSTYTPDVNAIVGILLERAGLTCSDEPSI